MPTFSKLKSGRIQAKIRRRGYKLSRTFRTMGLAREWAKGVEDAIDAGKYRGQYHDQPGLKTMPDLLERYAKEFTHRKRSWKVETYILNRLSREFANIPISQFRAEHVVAYADKRKRTGVSAPTIRKDLGKLSQALETGTALWGCEVAVNPVSVARRILGATKTLSGGVERDRRLLDGEEAALLASPIGHIVEFALLTAMRRGEIANARASHIRGDTLYIPETKTDKPRTIPLQERARAILEANPDGFGYAPRTISKLFLKACGEAGIDGLRLHDLRHEATSRFFERYGLTIEEVAAITGHSDWRMLKRYTHLRPSDIAKKL